MTKREKVMAATAGLVVVGLVTALAVSKVFLEPAARAQQQAVDLQDKLNRARAEKGKEKTYQARLKDIAAQAFGTDELRVSEQVRMVITDVLALSGLSSQNLSLKPLVGSRVPGVYREIGWSVRARGKQAQVISFLYLMSRDPHLHRLDNVVLAPVPSSPDVEVQVKYATLLLEQAKGEKLVIDEAPEPPPDASVLEAPERQQYDVIAMRDVFRPYIQAKPQPRASPQSDEPRHVAESPPQKGSEGRYRVVGLPTWGGKTEVLVRDSSSGKVNNLKAGDDFGGGKIVMVDYRVLPLPKNPEILSGSRVVLLIGSEYYAVELGQSLADKRTLAAGEVPPGLPKIEKPSPAGPEPQAGSAKQ
ncbi:MAG: hypothetical protein NT049_04750 [Planctomycetota bacterium]|nr:hypothetical protein [Planctomycetota bacterium]